MPKLDQTKSIPKSSALLKSLIKSLKPTKQLIVFLNQELNVISNDNFQGLSTIRKSQNLSLLDDAMSTAMDWIFSIIGLIMDTLDSFGIGRRRRALTYQFPEYLKN